MRADLIAKAHNPMATYAEGGRRESYLHLPTMPIQRGWGDVLEGMSPRVHY